MPSCSSSLRQYLKKHYGINSENATIMIEDEWSYIEDVMNEGELSIASLAKELVTIYMV